MIAFDPELRRKLAHGTPRAVLERAYRMRCGLVAAAQCCFCAWPIVKHQTTTEHDERCPAHRIIESMLRAAEASGL